MTKIIFRKPKPSPPKWYWADSDNCWNCNYNFHGCHNCKRLKKFKRYDRTREKKIFREYKEQSND